MAKSEFPRRSRTLDRGPPGTRQPVYTVGQIGPKRKLRPDGSLLCEDVPIARTGTQLYRPGEVPLEPPKRPGAAQVMYVTRDRAALFTPEALGSIVGAAITLGHPPVDVTPANWSTLAKGFVLDAWQGEGDAADLMFADLVITDKGLIHKINVEGLREVSGGYDANYEQTGDGEGRQHGIVFNHLALVERGRCGPRCAIGDRQPEETFMAQKNGTGGSRPRVRLSEATEAIRNALDSITDPDGDDEDGDGVHVHVHMGDDGRTRTGDGEPDDDPPRRRERLTLDTLAERVGDMEEGMLEIHGLLSTIAEKVGAASKSDPPSSTHDGDSAALQTSFMQFASQAEILVPGFKSPTFDSALPRAKTVDVMCNGRRQVLTQYGSTADGAAVLKGLTDDGFDVAQAPCDTIALVFKSAATLKGAANNRTGDRLSVPPAGAAQPAVMGGGMRRVTDTEINAANTSFWEKQQRST